MTEQIRRGTVKSFNESSGYGFIVPEEGGADVFVHITSVRDSGLKGLESGDVVEFETRMNDRKKKKEACNIKMVK